MAEPCLSNIDFSKIRRYFTDRPPIEYTNIESDNLKSDLLKVNNIYDSTCSPGKNGYFFVRDQRGVRWIQQLSNDPLCDAGIIQIKTNQRSDTSASVLGPTTSYSSTGIGVSITPRYNGSKLYIEFNGTAVVSGTGPNGVAFALYKNGVGINTNRMGDAIAYNAGSNTFYAPISISYVEDTVDRTPRTYELYFKYDAAWGTDAVNSGISSDWGNNIFTVKEISIPQ